MPSHVSSDPLIGGATPIEQVLRMLGLAANSGDPEDNATAADEHVRRSAMAGAAAEGFAAHDSMAADEVTDVVPQDQSAAAASQQLPQLLTGVAAAVSGGLSGLLQPLGQIPQQIAQGAQQLLQAGAGLSPPAGAVIDDEFNSIDDASLSSELLDEDLGYAADGLDGVGSSEGAAGLGDTAGIGAVPAPGVMLAAPATPSATTSSTLAPSAAAPSASTLPASAAGSPTPAPAAHIPPGGPGAGMAGMPMIPPAGLNGAGGADRDEKTDTKRIATPPLRNGTPVQGRITVPPPLITTTIEGKPVASRRIVMPAGTQTD